MQDISPKYITDLAEKVKETIWNRYKSYDMVKFYISKWQKVQWIGDDFDGYEQTNFEIVYKPKGEIDLMSTLNGIDNETLIKIAIDLGIDTPNFIPCIPTFKNMLKDEYSTTSEIFEKAYRLVYEEPNMAISLANSALESLIKEILKDERINIKYENGYTLKKLINLICKAFMDNNKDMPQEVRTISSSLVSISTTIDDFRSSKTIVHGKTEDDYIVSNPLYAELIVNSVATVGQFMQNYYKQNYPKIEHNDSDIITDDLPF